MNFNFVVRRFIASILTMPLAFAGWLFIWLVIVAFGSAEVGSFADFAETLPFVAGGWILFWLIFPKD